MLPKVCWHRVYNSQGIGKKKKRKKVLSIQRRAIKQMCYIYSTEYDLARKEKKIMLFPAVCPNRERTTQNPGN